MEIGRILQVNQPDVFANMKRHMQQKKNKKKRIKEEEIDFKKLMEQADTYRRGKGGALKRRR